ncbi:MAG TPA: glycosyltransferase family 4 protein [Anaerolineales bacterium]
MHVGLLIYGPLETLSGGYLYDRRLVDFLRRQGDRVEIIALPWRNYARHLSDNLSRALLDHLTHLDLDVLVQDELNHPSLFLLNRRLTKSAHYPLITLVHHLRSSEAGPGWQNRFYREVERRYLASVDGYIYNSRTTQQAAEQLFGEAAARPAVIAYPSGSRLSPQITDHAIQARARQPGPLRVFFLGNIIPRKGLHTLIEAVRRLPSGMACLEVAGRLDADRAYSARLQRQVEREGLNQRISFLGPLDDAALAERLQASQVLAVPSSYEGFGIVYLEGMGFGLPAIGGSAGGAKEVITPAANGYLVSPGDAAALAAVLQELAEDREHLAALGIAARHSFAAHPTWDESMGKIRSFLRGILI